jgi:hypothetical protein
MHPFLPSLLAVIFGGVGISAKRNRAVSGRGMAVAGLVLGIIGLLGWAVFGGTVYTLFLISKPARAEAELFTIDLTKGDIQAAHARCTGDISRGDLVEFVKTIKPWGRLVDLTAIGVAASTKGVPTRWELTGAAEFENATKAATLVVDKIDGKFKVAGFHFQ